MKITDEILNKIVFETQSKNEIIEKQIVSENVYAYDIFSKIIEFCKSKLLFSDNESVLLNYDDIVKLFPNRLKFLKYLNKNRNLSIICSDRFINQTNLKLSMKEIIELNDHIKEVNGYFSCDFVDDKDKSIILINSNVDFIDFDLILMHELIHFIQWSSGRIIHDFKTFDIDEKTLEEMKRCFHLNSFEFKFDKAEIETYSNGIFNLLKNSFDRNSLRFHRSILKSFINSFKNERFESFTEYFNDVNLKLKYIDNLIGTHVFSDVKSKGSMIYFYVVGFLKIGYTAMKNHLYRYYDIQFKNDE